MLLDPLTRLWTSLSEGLIRASIRSEGSALAFFGASITCLAVVQQRAKRLQAVSERSVGTTALAQLSLERRSTLTYAQPAPEALASADPTPTDSTATATAPKGNFFKFKPPVRTAPAPEALKLDREVAAVPSAESVAVAPPETPISSETSDDSRGIGLSANVTTRRDSYSARQQPADFADSDSDGGNSSDSTLDYKTRGVQFVDSDSESDSADSSGSESDSHGGNPRPSRLGETVGAGGGDAAEQAKAGTRGPRRTSTPGGAGATSPALPQQGWKSQFVVSVSKWEYNEAGDVVYTVQSNYTLTNFWTVRRTYGQFVAWFDSLGGATGELKDVKSPWPPAEFVLFYMPVETINKVSLLSFSHIVYYHLQSLWRI